MNTEAKKTRLKSIPIGHQRFFNRIYVSWYRKKFKRNSYLMATWIDPSNTEHDFLCQWDGKQIEIDGIGATGKLIFPLSTLEQSAFGDYGFTHVTFSRNSPTQAVLYPKEPEPKALSTQTISDLVMCDRISTMASITPQGLGAFAKKAVISAAVIMSIVVAFVVVSSMLQSFMVK